VAAGFSNKEIGAQLHLSEKTIKHYQYLRQSCSFE
jgi:DNA-binding NarL/FixJ family response regulator